MEKLFDYTPEAYRVSDESDYIRLEIKVVIPDTYFSMDMYCNQIRVWLPIGDTEESIATVPPLPFVDSTDWIAGQGHLIPAVELGENSSEDQMYQTYFFDNLKTKNAFQKLKKVTIGFLIEKARINAEKGIDLFLAESGTRDQGSSDFAYRPISLNAPVRIVKAAITEFSVVNKDDQTNQFTAGQPITVKWAGKDVMQYELYFEDEQLLIVRERQIIEYTIPGKHVKKGISEKETAELKLKAIDLLGNEAYHAITIKFDPRPAPITGLKIVSR